MVKKKGGFKSILCLLFKPVLKEPNLSLPNKFQAFAPGEIL